MECSKCTFLILKGGVQCASQQLLSKKNRSPNNKLILEMVDGKSYITENHFVFVFLTNIFYF